MQLLMHKPLWLHPQTLIHHRLSDTVFVVYRLQQQRGTNALVLLPSPQDEEERYLLSQCDRAHWHHFDQPRLVVDGNQSVWIDQPHQQLAIVGNGGAQRLELNLVHDAALKFAEAFDGEVVDINPNLIVW